MKSIQTNKTFFFLAAVGFASLLSVHAEAAALKPSTCVRNYLADSVTVNAVISAEVKACEKVASTRQEKLACFSDAYDAHKAEIQANLSKLQACLGIALPK